MSITLAIIIGAAAIGGGFLISRSVKQAKIDNEQQRVKDEENRARMASLAIALLGTFLFVSCQKDELSGKMYRGYYDPLQHMLIVFKDNSKVKAHMSSAEVLGFFSDDVYGYYVYRPPYIDIVWEKHARGNRVYNMYSPLPVPDSLRVNESMTELIWFEDEKEYHLKEDTLYHINKEDPFYKQAWDYLKESLFYVFLFIISHFIPICIIILVFIIVLDRIKARKRQK